MDPTREPMREDAPLTPERSGHDVGRPILNPFSLPVHRVVVYFPIAMLSAAWIGLIARYAMDKPRWEGRVMFLETLVC